MRHALFVLVLVVGCSRTQAPAPAPPEIPAAAPSATATASARPAATLAKEHAIDAKFEWGFWAKDGGLVLATPSDLWTVGMPCAEPVRTPAPIAALHAANGADRFVVEDTSGAFTLRDAATAKPIGRIDHPAPKRPGAVARDGSFVVLGGCKEIASDPKLLTSCGEIYDRDGKHVAGFTTKHPFEDLAIEGKWILARAATAGLSVIDATTGRTVVTRPGWRRMIEVHGYNRPDVHEIVGTELVVGHGDAVEAIDLATGKTVAKTTQPDRTVAALGPKTLRVAILQGVAGRVRVWDVATNKIVRTFELGKHIERGASCAHCAVEIDDKDEDTIWLTSSYTSDRLRLRIATGAIERVEAHELRPEGLASATHRLREGHAARATTCTLENRDTNESRPVDEAFCNRTHGPPHRGQDEWPYPGFDPTGRRLASIFRGELHVLDVANVELSCRLHR